MGKKDFVHFKINCPRDCGKIYPGEIVFVNENDERLPLPFNGCEFLNGSPSCEKCCAAITLMYYHGDVQPYCKEPISPKI